MQGVGGGVHTQTHVTSRPKYFESTCTIMTILRHQTITMNALVQQIIERDVQSTCYMPRAAAIPQVLL